MIRVRRRKCPPTLDCGDPKSAAAAEKAEARKFYAKKKNRFKNYSFGVYRRAEVKAALENLFHHKCAYCERLFSNSPIDVEHFRPKGGVVIDGEFFWPGYWWLAADWNNLLPSCIDCNRARWHRLPDEDKKAKHGKENLFPLDDEEYRAGWVEGEEESEAPLLLDPCRDRPESYLDFVQEAGGVEPRAKLTGYRRKRAKTSIKVYGLDRPVLRLSRADQQALVLEPVDKVIKALKALRQQPASKKRRQTLADELRDLLARREPGKEYLAFARAVSDQVLKEVRPWLAENLQMTQQEFLARYPPSALDRTPLQEFRANLEGLRG